MDAIRSKSTAALESDAHGDVFVTTKAPLSFAYADSRLNLEIPDCDESDSRAVQLEFRNQRLLFCAAPVLRGLAALTPALARSVELMGAVQRQGFDFIKGPYGRFAPAISFEPRGVTVPAFAADIDHVEALLLNPQFCIGEFIVFQLQKQGLTVDCRLNNRRRNFDESPDSDAALGEARRRTEREWDLTIWFAGPLG